MGWRRTTRVEECINGELPVTAEPGAIKYDECITYRPVSAARQASCEGV
jgi:hypothetical protein